MKREPTLEDYEKKLARKVKKKEIQCPKCGNSEDFTVNVLGHVFCNRCHTKIRWVDWE
ncbi:MAG: hypothetical protein ACE5HG_02890 [Candidatus Bathyarchaeia archaeon]